MKAKKVIAILTVLTLVIALAGCAASGGADGNGTANTPAPKSGETLTPEDTSKTDAASGAEAEEQALLPQLDGKEVVLNSLEDGTYHAAFSANNVKSENGKSAVTVTVYMLQQLDAAAVSQLKVGDTLTLGDTALTVESMEPDEDAGSIVINGEYTLKQEENGDYQVYDFSFAGVYTALGEMELPLAETFTFTDSSDLENPDVSMDLTGFLQSMNDDSEHIFQARGTTVTVTGGEITDIAVLYTP